MISSEGFFGIGIYTARHRRTAHHIRQVAGDDQHDTHTDQHGTYRAQWTGDREERRSGHRKYAPTDHTAKRHRPDINNRQIAIQRL